VPSALFPGVSTVVAVVIKEFRPAFPPDVTLIETLTVGAANVAPCALDAVRVML